jgi:hypothetical protein
MRPLDPVSLAPLLTGFLLLAFAPTASAKPESSRIMFERRAQIFTMNVDGSGVQPVPDTSDH